jgi:hypothetical protein
MQHILKMKRLSVITVTLVDANFLNFLSGNEDFGGRSSTASFLNL